MRFEVQWKTDQKVAVRMTFDVLTVLPSGFGKSLLFQALVMASKMASNDHATAMVYMPLNRITEELQMYKSQIGSEF